MVRSSSVNSLRTESSSHISISEDKKSSPNVSNSGNLYPGSPPTRGVYRSRPRFSGTPSTHQSQKKAKPSTHVTRVHSSYRIPRSPSASISKSSYLHSLEAKRATLGYLERIKGRHNIPSYVQLRVPRVDEQPKCPSIDEIALHIDLFDVRLRLPLQPSFMRMFSYLSIALKQLSLLGWRTHKFASIIVRSIGA